MSEAQRIPRMQQKEGQPLRAHVGLKGGVWARGPEGQRAGVAEQVGGRLTGKELNAMLTGLDSATNKRGWSQQPPWGHSEGCCRPGSSKAGARRARRSTCLPIVRCWQRSPASQDIYQSPETHRHKLQVLLYASFPRDGLQPPCTGRERNSHLAIQALSIDSLTYASQP